MDFVVILHVAEEDPRQVEECLLSFRTYHPDTPLHLVTDGNPDPVYRDLAHKYHTDYTSGRYLKRSETGDRWWRRFLETGQSYHKTWLLKIDPDTRFWRPLKEEPHYPVAGTHDNIGKANENVQGGCQAIHHEAAEEILRSGALDTPELRDCRTYCPNPLYVRTWIPQGYFSTDYSLMYTLNRLHIPYGNWTEVGCRWLKAPNNKDLKYAVTHPHKNYQVPKGIPQTEPLRIITTCKGRLHHLKQALPTWKREPNVQITVVDYSCPDQTKQWVAFNHPEIQVIDVPGHPTFHLADARNTAAKHTPTGWWCFLDADIKVKPGWANAVRGILQKGHYHTPNPLEWGMTGSAIIHSDDYKKSNGYDEQYRGWGPEDIDFYATLRQIGIRSGTWPGEFATSIKHDDTDRTRHYTVTKAESLRQGELYHQAKINWMRHHEGIPDYATRLALQQSVSYEQSYPPPLPIDTGYRDHKTQTYPEDSSS